MVAIAKSPEPHTLGREIKYRAQQSTLVLCWFIGELFVVCWFFAVAMWDTAICGRDADEQMR